LTSAAREQTPPPPVARKFEASKGRDMAVRKKAKVAKKKAVKRSKTKAKAPAKKTRAVAKKSKKAGPARKTAARKPVKAKKKAPAKKVPVRKKKQIVGEGDYEASRAFLKDQTGFVKENKARIPALGQEARAALEGSEGPALLAAEAEARGHAKNQAEEN
jgi:hypothetical protein